MFFACLYFFLLILLFKMAPTCSPEVLACPEREKAVMCLAEKIHPWDKLPSGTSDSAIGCEFSINESTICIT